MHFPQMEDFIMNGPLHMDWSLQVIYLCVSLPKEIFSLITHKIISFSAAPLSLEILNDQTFILFQNPFLKTD